MTKVKFMLTLCHKIIKLLFFKGCRDFVFFLGELFPLYSPSLLSNIALYKKVRPISINALYELAKCLQLAGSEAEGLKAEGLKAEGLQERDKWQEPFLSEQL
ncbi:MAG: hypothetical protein K9K78_07770 [Spirochaetales bacterium]|nr:hypothetical protein [Spirochaetales bacterium]